MVSMMPEPHRPTGFCPASPHNMEGGVHGVLVDYAGLNGPVRGPHAAGDVAAFESRPGGAGARHQEILVAEGDLTIGAQVNEEAELRFVPNQAGKHTGSDVAAHIGADVGSYQHRSQGIGGGASNPPAFSPFQEKKEGM